MARSKEQLKAASKLLKKPAGRFVQLDLSTMLHPHWMTRCYKNNRYIVMIDDYSPMSDGSTAIKAMIQRHDDAVFPNHWQELQNIKNEIFGYQSVAVEFFPAEKDLSDKANIYWLYLYPNGNLPVPVQD